jgi:NhaP-type Na+/H+ or K+/H+ antiporter
MSRFCPSVPYTVVLLIEGFTIGYIHELSEHGLGDLSVSLEMWSSIDPHLLLFAFLPPLLFSDSMGLNWYVWKRCLGQCLLLAGPGVLIGTGLTAAVAKYCFSYGWSWPQCLLFGSILAATDPVAVVAILKELGVPDKLTMCVSGESLLNDGTAIVLFNLFKALSLDTKSAMEGIGMVDGVSPLGVIRYFLYMSVGGIALGCTFGLVGVLWLSRALRRTSHEDPIIQFAVTLCLAYLTFFIGEHFAGVSGVLATVAAALTMAASGRT